MWKLCLMNCLRKYPVTVTTNTHLLIFSRGNDKYFSGYGRKVTVLMYLLDFHLNKINFNGDQFLDKSIFEDAKS